MIAVAKGKRGSRRSEPGNTVGIIRDEGRESRERMTAPEPLPADPEPQPTPTPTPTNMSGTPMPDRISTPIAVLSLIFDQDWYNRAYPDVAAVKLDPVRHYLDNGSREGRNPNPYFDTNWYVSNNPDVAAAGLNPFLHYLLYGAREGRQPAP